MKDRIWITRKGTKVHLSVVSNSHLANIIRFIKRQIWDDLKWLVVLYIEKISRKFRKPKKQYFGYPDVEGDMYNE